MRAICLSLALLLPLPALAQSNVTDLGPDAVTGAAALDASGRSIGRVVGVDGETLLINVGETIGESEAILRFGPGRYSIDNADGQVTISTTLARSAIARLAASGG